MRKFVIWILRRVSECVPETVSNKISKINYLIAGYANFLAELFDNSSKKVKLHNIKTSRRLDGPSIACVVPVHNVRKKWLRMLLDSIELNNFDEVVLIISGENTQETKTLCLGRKISNLRCEIEADMTSIALKTNIAIKTSKSDYVVLLDHDDFLAPNSSEIIRKYLNKNKEVDVLTTEFALVSSDEQNLRSALNTYESVKPIELDVIWFLQTNYIVHLVCMKRDIVLKTGLMNPEFDFSQDVELWLRLISGDAIFRHIQVATYGWRHHPKSVADGSQAKPEIIGRHKRAIEEFIENTGHSGQAEELVYRGQHTGNFRISAAVEMLEQASIALGKCDYSEELKGETLVHLPSGWFMVVPSCLSTQKIEIDKNLFSTIQHMESRVGAVGLTIANTKLDWIIYGEVPNVSQKNWGWDLDNHGFFGRNLCIHKCEALASPAVIVRGEILFALQKLQFLGCSDLGTTISRLCKELNLEALIDPLSSLFAPDNWVESHGHQDFKALIKVGI